MRPLLGFLLFAVTACHPRTPAPATAPHARSSSFDYVGQDWLRFDAVVADQVKTHLILDTGGGVTLLSEALCKRLGCVPDGTYSGKRMSGQELVLPMARVASLEIAGHRVTNLRVAVLDTTSLLHPELGVDGFVGLDAFRGQPFTLDYEAHRLILEDEPSLGARRGQSQVVPVHVKDDGTSVEVYLPLKLAPDAPLAEMEVDSGSRDLILDERFMKTLGIAPDGAGVKRQQGKDETANGFTRYFATLPRALRVPGAPDANIPAGATVMFQRIIHDGLVGHTFLSANTVTFDLGRQEMLFGKSR